MDFANLQDDILRSALFVVLVLVVLFVLVRIAVRLVPKYVSEPTRQYHITKIIRRIGYVLAAVAVALLIEPETSDVLTIITIIGTGLAIALREVLLSAAGWLRIAFTSPYQVGDRIEIGGLRGDVIDIRMQRTTLMEIGGWVDADQSTGRIAHFPNGWLFQHAVYNYTRGFHFIWNELPVTLTHGSDWKKAREIARTFIEESSAIVEQQAASQIKQLSGEFLIHYSIMSPFVYVRVAPTGIQLTLRYLCDVRKRRGTEHAITISLLDAFAEHDDIELASSGQGLQAIGTRTGTASPPLSPS